MNSRSDFVHFQPIATRWKDNDIYGHVNNVEYYSYFDTVINMFLISEGSLDIHSGGVIGVCAESHCKYSGGFAFPETIDAGLRVERLGNSSVRYGVGLFSQGAEEAAAVGWFVHVFVDRLTRKPITPPESLRTALERLRIEIVA
jgi:acyl-CoA thioester hydrolase